MRCHVHVLGRFQPSTAEPKVPTDDASLWLPKTILRDGVCILTWLFGSLTLLFLVLLALEK